MWVKEYIAIECLNCPKKWTNFHEWRDEDDDTPHPTTKGYMTKAWCKECKQKIEEKERQSKDQKNEDGSKKQ
jgi:hypothetical protein